MSATSVGLMARPGPSGEGEVLIPDAGFTTVDGANLPLVTDDVPAAGEPSGNTCIALLGQFNRTTAAGAKAAGSEYDGPTLLAFIAGDGSTAGSAELWRVKPSDGTWEQVRYNLAAATLAHEAEATREFLSDWAEFPAGAPDRGEYSGNIAEPVFVWCNLHDRVMVYPTPDPGAVGGALLIENGTYEPLTDQFGAAFSAATVEHFGGRLYFGNTKESGTQHRQRIRRTRLFTADPDPTEPGAGAFDIRDFSGDLLRLEKLGDLMVAYFEDGTAFIRLSDIATAPDRVQLLREKRGLMATHAVCSVGNQEHFGIFDDGWFFLDPSGRWTEVGLLNIDGTLTPKWKETFYNKIDMNYRHRTVVSYDGSYIRIAFTPLQGDGSDVDNQEVWVFDPRGNRVFRDTYPVTVWGEGNLQIRAATDWDDISDTWSSISGSWASYAAKFGVKSLLHGSTTGYVMSHDYDLITRINVDTGAAESPSYSFVSQKLSFRDPTELKTALKLWLEYIHTGPGNVTLTVTGDSIDGSDSGQVSFSTDTNPGDIEVLFRTFNFTSRNIQFSVGGTAPVMIRSILADLTMKGRQIGDSVFIGTYSGSSPTPTPSPTPGSSGTKGGGRR
jgi:hypothetical protein